MQAPTSAQLLADVAIQQALEKAWMDSQVGDPTQRHEEGGWIYMDVTTGVLTIRAAQRGMRSPINLEHPLVVLGAVVVGKFHTHPNPTAEGWVPGPSAADRANAVRHGVPSLIRADDGIHVTGPNNRRGGLSGNLGYPD